MKQTTLTGRLLSGGFMLGLLLACLSGARADDRFAAPALSRGDFSEAGQILPVDEAFRFGSYEEGESLRLFWQVLPGYYLYRDKFRFEQAGSEVHVELPGGHLRQDEIFGEVEVLTGFVEVSLPLVAGTRVYYQGCAERGYCYPPQKRVLTSANQGLFSGNHDIHGLQVE